MNDEQALDAEQRPYTAGFRPAVYDWDGWTCADCPVCGAGAACADCAACTAFAAPYPPHWAKDWRPGEPYRGIELFGGPGGMAAGRSLVDRGGDWVLIEVNPHAAATARAAGHWVVEADVRTLDPRQPVLRWTHRVHGSPPCGTFSGAGLRSGWDTDEVALLQSLMWQATEAFGFLPVDDLCSLYGGPHDYHGGCMTDPEGWDEDLCEGGVLPPCVTPDQFRQEAAELVSDDRTALMVEMLIWPMCLVQIGAPLISITMEQSANLLRQSPGLAEALQSEITSPDGFGWAWCSFQVADAADFGAATHRERAWMVATRYEWPRYAVQKDGEAPAREMWAPFLRKTGQLPDFAPELTQRLDFYQGRPALPVVSVAEALGLPESWWADTRGKRTVDPKTGRVRGGGSFPLDAVGQCVTATWYGVRLRPADVPQGQGTMRLSLPDLGVLVGMRRDYPWTYIPTRKGATGIRNLTQMIADMVSVFIGAAVSASVDGGDWYLPAVVHQARIYRLDRRKRAPLPCAAEPTEMPLPNQQLGLFEVEATALLQTA
ncbi:C-5 cytosine-specific DNA methylase [Actinacidiphila alni]|uniref:C-5 cytosine-specific DNA methylase n=1 Tax=Actinacidiphila alni TaxID=380248 RepID=A0A1I2L5W0_9ACTN|nr:DNA cytosine methyltransferase [Actinacidiphila alni]SFF74714.1 C-5 cytosine-specific DNA methylase [Actinacidiphila alni]